jgi:anaerobic selenocysteine-containing dehydrogenase
VLPDTTYLERWDCISLLDRPISGAEAPADAIRQPIIAPDRDVRPFQDVLLDLGARLRLPGMAKDDGSAVYPGGYSDYMVNHERRPGVGMLAGWRGPDGGKTGTGEPNPDQLKRYIENGCFWEGEIPPEAGYFRNVNKAYLAYAVEMAFVQDDAPIIAQLYAEELQRFRLAARGHGHVQPPEDHRARVETYFDPLPFWYPTLEDQIGADDGGNGGANEDYPLYAVTQRPMAMYHSWGTPNAWLRQIHGANRLYVPRAAAEAKGIADDDWVWLSSRTGRIKVQVRLMEGVNPHTVWTWNAVGKRAGTWGLGPKVGETEQGFLLNHLIDECLPVQPGGYRYSNSDPVTGQAAWYDVRVRMEKVAADEAVGETAPQFEVLGAPPGLAERPKIWQLGKRKAKEPQEPVS